MNYLNSIYQARFAASPNAAVLTGSVLQLSGLNHLVNARPLSNYLEPAIYLRDINEFAHDQDSARNKRADCLPTISSFSV